MFNIHILALGSIKESHWKDAIDEYTKRLGPYAKLAVTELKEEPFRKGDDPDAIKKKEAEKLLPYFEKVDIVVAMHERGKQFDSPAFAKWLEEHSTKGEKILFAIGGPLGFDEELLKKADLQLSLSELTFPHQLARVLLVEQIYRAGTIIAGKQYHY